MDGAGIDRPWTILARALVGGRVTGGSRPEPEPEPWSSLSRAGAEAPAPLPLALKTSEFSTMTTFSTFSLGFPVTAPSLPIAMVMLPLPSPGFLLGASAAEPSAIGLLPLTSSVTKPG